MAENAGLTPSGSSSNEGTYEPKPSIQYASTVALQAGAVGAFVSAVQNALGSHSSGASGFLTRSGGTIGIFGTPASFFYVLGRSRDSTQLGLEKLQWALHSR